MIDAGWFVAAGALVGFCVGVTGVGGGSLMTPLLLIMGIPSQIAIGTDLLYAAITKSGGAFVHIRKRNIEWRVVGLLGAGSIPASALTVWALSTFFTNANEYKHVLTVSLGVMLAITGLSLILRKQIQALHDASPRSNALRQWLNDRADYVTFFMGIALGVLVTLSSVGAGAFGVMILVALFPALTTFRIIGTDVTHAVALTLVAGLGHMKMGNVDWNLLGLLICGSLPAIYVGTHLSARMPENTIRPILGATLLALSVKFVFY